MIQTLANSLAEYIAKNDETANKEELAYGYGLIFMAITIYATVLLSALLFGVFAKMLIAVGAFTLMRATVGGCHVNHRAVCIASYTGIAYLAIFLSGILYLNLYAIAALYLVNVILLTLYAPGDTEEQPMVHWRLARNVVGLILISAIFSLSLILRDMQVETNIAILTSTANSIYLHPYIYKAYRCKRSKYK